MINVYTDGACSGNPGPGGWAMAICLKDEIFTLSGGIENTTNNRMELAAIINALNEISKMQRRLNMKEKFVIHSDSAYCVSAINNGWVDNWQANGWLTKNKDQVKNIDLWSAFWPMYKRLTKSDSIKFVHIRGHKGIEGNELVDKLARAESLKRKK